MEVELAPSLPSWCWWLYISANVGAGSGSGLSHCVMPCESDHESTQRVGDQIERTHSCSTQHAATIRTSSLLT